MSFNKLIAAATAVSMLAVACTKNEAKKASPAPQAQPTQPADESKVEKAPTIDEKKVEFANEFRELEHYIDSLEDDLDAGKAKQGNVTVGTVLGSIASFSLATYYGVKSNPEFLKSVEEAHKKAGVETQKLIKERIAAIQEINSHWVFNRKDYRVASKYALPDGLEMKETTRILPDNKGGFLIEMIREVPAENNRKVGVIRMQQPLDSAKLKTDIVILEGFEGHGKAFFDEAAVKKIREQANLIRMSTNVDVKVSRLNSSAVASIGFGIATAVIAGLGVAANLDTPLNPSNEAEIQKTINEAREKLAKLEKAQETAKSDKK